eukprot:GFUD01033357.1.p1 GENE.GFUD01033357.1~~GFUD01033357.1.p1  ORF type:complete len:394 (-),score=94.77 GFUD01033357.1:124-1305(-)
MDSLCQTVWVISSFLLFLFDQGTDALTALLFFLDGHYLEGVLTALLIFTPGMAACMLELRDMWRGKGNILKAIVYLVMCPLWALLTHLYSVFNKQWQSKALMLKTMEGFLCAAPQLVLQLSFWMRGTLTTPMEMILADQFNVTKQSGDVNMTIFGRDFDSNERYWFGIAQFLSILISFISVFSSVIYFNRLEANSVRSVGKLCLGIPFFFLTIVYRSVGLALLLCFLRWWSSIIIFLLFFTTVLTALCIGDRFGRSCLYGIWSLLAPVGYSRDPVSPLGYYSIQSLDILEIEELSQPQVVQDGQRSSYFLTSHMLSSLLILFPSLAILTVLVHRAQVISSLTISTTSIFPTSYISMVFLPTLGLCLAVSLLLVRPFLSADCTKGEAKKGNILV